MALFNDIMRKMGLHPKDTNLAEVIAERDQLLRDLAQLQTEYIDLREKTRTLVSAAESLKEEYVNLFRVMQSENEVLRATLIQTVQAGGKTN